METAKKKENERMWWCAAFQNGDAVVVEAGVVTHLASRKRVPLEHSYAPVPLATRTATRTRTPNLNAFP